MIRYLEWNKRGYKLNYKNIFKKKELKMESFFNNILGKMNIEEKVAQLFVFAIHGPLPDTNLIEFIKKYGVGGLRIQPCSDRKAAKYMSDGGIVDQRTVRHPVWGEKFPDTSIRSSIMPPKQYAGFLNGIRSSSATFKKYGVPVHTVMDGEEGGGDYGAPHIISMPQQMGFGELGDMELLAESWEAFARQYKAVGIDWIHSPVVDVNVNPKNPEISTRAFSSNADVVTKCAEVEISALKRGGLISCVKHFPGRGDSDSDAHFGVPTIEAEIGKMEAIHLKPYHDLIKKGVVQSVMLAHSVYPALDNSGELATVSEIIIKKLLRGKLGFRGVITTDALTMGGLMKMHSVDEACIMTIAAGTDLLLHKSETSLRFEPFHALVNAVKSGRIAESVIDESLCRTWQLKYDMGLFEKGGIVDPSRAEA